MDQTTALPEPTCSHCHVPVRPTDFFCYNCGRNLHEPPKALGAASQAAYYIGSVLMPPMGIFWGIKFLRQDESRTRRAGIICIALTVVSMLYYAVQIMRIYGTVSAQIGPQIQAIQGL